ncbi:MAG: type I methionyl aminopeptidase [bacterium]
MISYKGRLEVEIKSPEEIAKMQAAGGLLRDIRERMVQLVRPGVTTLSIDRKVRQWIEENNARPAFLGLYGFPATICTSINEEVVHGIPSERQLVEGDLISFDLGLIKDGFFVDTAVTVAVGEVDEESRRLMEVTSTALEIAIEQARPGVRLGDLGQAIQTYVEGQGFNVVRDYTGHGIGRQLHEDPKIPNFGQAGTGPRLMEGMVICLEPMVCVGTWKTRTLDDHWTVVTADGKRAAHFEHTVAITASGPRVLT